MLFVNPQKSPYQNLSPKSLTQKQSLKKSLKVTKISNPKKVLRSQISSPKRASHIPVTYIPEYPAWGYTAAAYAIILGNDDKMVSEM